MRQQTHLGMVKPLRRMSIKAVGHRRLYGGAGSGAGNLRQEPRDAGPKPSIPHTGHSTVDARDLALLAALRDDARITLDQMSARTGLAPTTIAERVARLRSAGVITGLHARIDYRMLGYGICAYVAISAPQKTTAKDELTRTLLEIPEVEEVAWVSGEDDLLVRLWARDAVHLRGLVEQLAAQGPCRTMLVFGDPVQKAGIGFEVAGPGPSAAQDPAPGRDRRRA
jgi:DNA-binding Lrp family transcriptional regulator